MSEKRADEIFSSNIKYIREKNGLKQSDVAEALHVTNQAVSKWESGKSLPEINTMVEIAKLFNVSTDEILSTDLREKDTDEQIVESPKERYQVRLLQGQYNAETKSLKIYKSYIIALIIVLLLPLGFAPVPFDIATSFILLGVIIINFICIICFIRTLVDIKRKYISNKYLKALPAFATIDLLVGLWIIVFIVIMDSSTSEISSLIPLYILFCIDAFLNGTVLCISNVFYQNARRSIEE